LITSIFVEDRSLPVGCVRLDKMTGSVTKYLVEKKVISKNEAALYNITEQDLIKNRLQQTVEIDREDLVICPDHRYYFGLGWRRKNHCYHDDHKNTKQSTRRSYRIASYEQCNKLSSFPWGGSICDTHRKKLSEDVVDCMTKNTSETTFTNNQSVASIERRIDDKETVNNILAAVGVDPITTQTRMPLRAQEPSSVRRLASKFRNALEKLAKRLAESIAPGEGDTLINISGFDNLLHPRQRTKSVSLEADSSLINYLVEMYKEYDIQYLPYNEKIRILALLPDEWLYKDIMKTFGCTRHAAKASRHLRAATKTPLHIEPHQPIVRSRIDATRTEHFITWLVETNTMISVPWGYSKLKFDTGDTVLIPKQVIQAKKTHIIYQYKEHCQETNYAPLSDRFLWDMLGNFDAREQKSVSCVDDFAKSAR
jgi:hypothetical protein